MAFCLVSYLDISGIRHTVEVEASGLYEAAALALRTFRQHDCEPGAMGKLEVEVRSAITHTLTVQRLQNWLDGGAKNPKEAVLKERLRAML
jgi:hypothetical protein